MNLHFNDAKIVRPKHLERCLCWDKFEKSYRCYVYDDISKYWCTQATIEHDPDGENHIVDYADYQVTKWATLSDQSEPYPQGLDEAAEKAGWEWACENKLDPYSMGQAYSEGHKAGAKWDAEQGVSKKGEITWRMDGTLGVFVVLKESDGFKRGEQVIVQIQKNLTEGKI